MSNNRVIVFLYIACSFFCSCVSSAQINGIKVVEENNEKRYIQVKTKAFKSDATILRDTTSEFNRYPSAHAVEQYIPSLTDVQVYEDVLKNRLVPDNEGSASSNETFASNFNKFNRQYSGYINKAGDTVLVVCFLDFSNTKEAKKFFYDWKYRNGYLGSGLFLDRKPPSIYCYSFNLQTKALNRYKI